MFERLAEFHDWWEQRAKGNTYEVKVVGLDQLDGWRFDPDSGNLAHRTGRFFSVEGIDVATDHRETAAWSQPIILQPEIGILGILIKRFDGVPHCLMQAKMEPGNVNTLQLSPTVQATRSNYTRVHQGHAVPYLEHFVAPRRGRVLFDALQSEQGSWFLAKRNRNIIVEVDEEVPLLEDFCWLRLDQIQQLMRAESLINMDSRTVLSGMPLRFAAEASEGAPLHTNAQLLSWFTEAKARYRLDRRVIRLSEVKNWIRSHDRISHELGLFFTVIGVDVQATNREVKRWSQPMLAPTSEGIIAFIRKRINGTPHLLVQAMTEPGTQDVVEMSATVNCSPANHQRFAPERRPRFLDYVLSAPRERILLDAIYSEEGGRFYHAQNRYQVIEAGDDFPLEVPPDFAWMTVPQLASFVRYGNHVSVGARSLLSCIAH